MTRTLRTLKLFATAAAVVLVITAWSAASGSSQVRAHAAGATATVTIKNFMYMPAKLTVAQGTTVTFHNADSTNHTVTANGRAFNISNLAPGRSAKVTFNHPGTYAYHCVFHPFMKAEIVVR